MSDQYPSPEYIQNSDNQNFDIQDENDDSNFTQGVDQNNSLSIQNNQPQLVQIAIPAQFLPQIQELIQQLQNEELEQELEQETKRQLYVNRYAISFFFNLYYQHHIEGNLVQIIDGNRLSPANSRFCLKDLQYFFDGNRQFKALLEQSWTNYLNDLEARAADINIMIKKYHRKQYAKSLILMKRHLDQQPPYKKFFSKYNIELNHEEQIRYQQIQNMLEE